VRFFSYGTGKIFVPVAPGSHGHQYYHGVPHASSMQVGFICSAAIIIRLEAAFCTPLPRSDGTLAQKKGTPRQLKYKVHQSIDADSRVILDTEVTTGARHDNQPYLSQLQRIQKRYMITIREATADRGYGSAAIIRSLQEAGITTYIPLWSGRVGNSKYLKGKLVYDKKRDRFRCPRGKYLTPNPAICSNQKRYVSSSVDCRHCPRRSICPTEAIKKLPYKRYVRRSLDQDLYEEVQTRMEKPEFRKKLSERMWKAEGLFAEPSAARTLTGPVVFSGFLETNELMRQQQKAASLAYTSASKVKSATFFDRYTSPHPRHGFRALFIVG
jgi:hypothetical protein